MVENRIRQSKSWSDREAASSGTCSGRRVRVTALESVQDQPAKGRNSSMLYLSSLLNLLIRADIFSAKREARYED